MSTPEKRFADKFCKAFEKAGWTTINMESLGDGVPDRQAIKEGATIILEAKIYPNWLTKHQEIWIKKYFKNNCPLYVVSQARKKIMLIRIYLDDNMVCSKYYQSFDDELELVKYFDNFYKGRKPL